MSVAVVVAADETNKTNKMQRPTVVLRLIATLCATVLELFDILFADRKFSYVVFFSLAS